MIHKLWILNVKILRLHWIKVANPHNYGSEINFKKSRYFIFKKIVWDHPTFENRKSHFKKILFEKLTKHVAPVKNVRKLLYKYARITFRIHSIYAVSILLLIFFKAQVQYAIFTGKETRFSFWKLLWNIDIPTKIWLELNFVLMFTFFGQSLLCSPIKKFIAKVFLIKIQTRIWSGIWFSLKWVSLHIDFK